LYDALHIMHAIKCHVRTREGPEFMNTKVCMCPDFRDSRENLAPCQTRHNTAPLAIERGGNRTACEDDDNSRT